MFGTVRNRARNCSVQFGPFGTAFCGVQNCLVHGLHDVVRLKLLVHKFALCYSHFTSTMAGMKAMKAMKAKKVIKVQCPGMEGMALSIFRCLKRIEWLMNSMSKAAQWHAPAMKAMIQKLLKAMKATKAMKAAKAKRAARAPAMKAMMK